MYKIISMAALLSMSSMAMADDLITPADLSHEAQEKMFTMVSEYNRCMLMTEPKNAKDVKTVQDYAQALMDQCESHMQSLKTFLSEQHVNEPLIEGMSKTLRSKAARQLMTRSMNNMAAQAAAAEISN